MPLLSVLLACFTSLAVLLLFFANKELAATLSPQGCRMSFMSPSYVLQDSFNASWSHLASRYSLWLYREVGWDTQVGFAFGLFPVTQLSPSLRTVYLCYLFQGMLALPTKSAR